MDWLKNELQNAQSYRYRFVFMHVPLYDPRKGSYTEGHSIKDLNFARKLNEVFDEYNVTMLFCSHIHAYYHGVWGKTPYIITGGAGAELDGSDPKHDFYHYIKVTISDTGVSYNVVKLRSPGLEFTDRLFHDIWLYVYSFLTIHFLDIVIVLSLAYLAFHFFVSSDKKG